MISRIHFESSIIDKLIKSFPSGSAPGPDQLRPQHLQDLRRVISPNEHNDFRPSLIRLMSRIASGEIPESVAPYFSSSRLIPLKKEPNGIRPIAIGNTFRRLTAKALVLLTEEKIKDYLSPLQFGVGIKGGTEIIVHSIRLLLQHHQQNKDFVVFQADFRNAFNTISRNEFMKIIQQEFPELYPYVYTCYAFSPPLYLNDNSNTTLKSLNGSAQGDPLGPLLYCLGIHSFIQKLSTQSKRITNLWYMDDGTIAGPTEDVLSAISTIQEQGPSRGMYLNTTKSSLYWPSGSEFNSYLFPEEILRCSDGINLLGVPLGSTDYINSKFNDKIQKRTRSIQKLPKLEDPQIAVAILSKCLSLSKVNYFIRSSPPQLTKKLCSEFDAETTRSIEIILGTNLSLSSKIQISLPIKDSGLGLRSAESHAPAAFLSSFNSLESIIQKSLSITQDLNFKSVSSDIKLPALKALSTTLEKDLNDKIFTSIRQRTISEAIDKHQFSKLLEYGLQPDKARILSCCGTHSSMVLNAPISSYRGFKLSPMEFHHFTATRLGLSISNEGDICSECGIELDVFGYHASICKFGTSVIDKHNALRNEIFSFCQNAAWNPKLEVTGLIPNSPQLCPADIFLPLGSKGLPVALDVTSVHPLASRYISTASREQDATTRLAEERKRRKYVEKCLSQKIEYIPLAVEYYGRWGNSAKEFFNKLSTGLHQRVGGKASLHRKEIERRLAFIIIKHNAKAANRRRNI